MTCATFRGWLLCNSCSRREGILFRSLLFRAHFEAFLNRTVTTVSQDKHLKRIREVSEDKTSETKSTPGALISTSVVAENGRRSDLDIGLVAV